MSKRVSITETIAGRIRRAADPDIDVDGLAVYEAIALNTLPINQRGTLFDGARVSEDTLTALASTLRMGAIPIQIMHETRTLPVGKAFWSAITYDKRDRPQLAVQFFVPTAEADLVRKIDTGVVDEVSIGFQAQSIRCSKCGFDYLGPDADFTNVWSLTCDKGHEIGKDGVHAKVDGLDTLHELSLVGKGAASGAKILSQPGREGTALAAKGAGKALILQLSATKEPDMPDPTTATVNLAELTGLAAQLSTAQTELNTAKFALEAKTAEAADLTAKLAAAEAKAPDAAMLSFLTGQWSKLHVALGQKDATAPAAAAELMAGIADAQAKLMTLIPPGGVSHPAAADAGAASAGLSLFKTRR